MQPEAEDYIEKLGLKAHPEGGYYSEMYRSEEYIPGACLPERYGKTNHSFSTSIYFLLEGNQISKLHRLNSDEIWYYQAGSRAIIYLINQDGTLTRKSIGNNLAQGDDLQIVIKRNTFFCAELENKRSYILVGCNVSPGFEFADFELGDKNSLLRKFPDHHEIISKFT